VLNLIVAHYARKLNWHMSQDRLIKLQCTKCKNINYHSTKNKKTVEKKIELKKHCAKCKAHTIHKEMKK